MMTLDNFKCPNSKCSSRCKACNGTGYIPGRVIDSIQESFPVSFENIMQTIRWDCDCFVFNIQTIAVAIEPNGFMVL